MKTSSSNRRPSKRHKTSDKKALDRISILPDSLIEHVLAFLPAKYAIRTSVLSRRWQFCWTFIPVIDLADPLLRRSDRVLRYRASSIKRTLILHQSPKLNKFCVRFYYKKKFTSDIHLWLYLVTEKNVEELELYFLKETYCYPDENATNCYVLPLSVLHNSHLVSLKLVQCGLVHRHHINWRSLKVLALRKMNLSNDLIREILVGSPLLESLELCKCWGFDFLDIQSETMRKLVVNDYGRCWNLNSDVSLKISAPNIKSLEILGSLNMRKLLLINSLSVVDARLNFHLAKDALGNAKDVQELLENLRHVKDLTVGYCCLESLGLLGLRKTMPSLLSELECLRVCTFLRKNEYTGIVRLLSSIGRKSTPLTLVMNSEGSGVINVESFWTSQKYLFSAALERTKIVKFVDFMAQESQMQLILFLLKNAVQLEKMIIHKHPRVDVEKSLEIAQRILSFPRWSRDAVVLFS